MSEKKLRFIWVKPQELVIDLQVQRNLRQRRVNKIAEDFDPAALGTVVLAERSNGELVVIDGQHRIAAARLAGQEDTPVHAEVHTGLSPQEEAALFRRKNNTEKVGPVDRHRVAVTEGNPLNLAIESVAHAYGFRVSQGTSKDSFAAVAGATRIVATGGERGAELLRDTFEVVTKAWPHDRLAVDGRIIEGVAYFLHRHGPLVDKAGLIHKLALYEGGPSGFIAEMRALVRFRRGKLSDAAAELVTRAYNRGKSTKALPDWK